MKFITTIALALMISSAASASGKVSVQGNLLDDGKTVRPVYGLAIYEHMIDGVMALNSWTSYGNQSKDLDISKQELITKNQLDLFIGNLTISPGVQYAFTEAEFDVKQLQPYAKLDYKLW